MEQLLARLGGTLAPLALVSVGYQLRLNDLQGRLAPLSLGLTFKLLLGPLLITAVLVKGFGLVGPITQVSIFEAAMAPQIGGAIVAMEHKLDPPLVTLMVGIGIPLSFVTLPVWVVRASGRLNRRQGKVACAPSRLALHARRARSPSVAARLLSWPAFQEGPQRASR